MPIYHNAPNTSNTIVATYAAIIFFGNNFEITCLIRENKLNYIELTIINVQAVNRNKPQKIRNLSKIYLNNFLFIQCFKYNEFQKRIKNQFNHISGVA